ncbi:MAG: hypothetical protein FJ333_01945 [Sphingomonadales bacterium]|nr:hypothetical protein [Sphingomonadales bacterium]
MQAVILDSNPIVPSSQNEDIPVGKHTFSSASTLVCTSRSRPATITTEALSTHEKELANQNVAKAGQQQEFVRPSLVRSTSARSSGSKIEEPGSSDDGQLADSSSIGYDMDKECPQSPSKHGRRKSKRSEDLIRPTTKCVIDLYLAGEEELQDIPGIDDEVASTVVSLRSTICTYEKFITR